MFTVCKGVQFRRRGWWHGVAARKSTPLHHLHITRSPLLPSHTIHVEMLAPINIRTYGGGWRGVSELWHVVPSWRVAHGLKNVQLKVYRKALPLYFTRHYAKNRWTHAVFLLLLCNTLTWSSLGTRGYIPVTYFKRCKVKCFRKVSNKIKRKRIFFHQRTHLSAKN